MICIVAFWLSIDRSDTSYLILTRLLQAIAFDSERFGHCYPIYH